MGSKGLKQRQRNPLTRNQKIGIGVGLTAVVVVGGVVVYRRVTKEEPKDDDDTDDSGGGRFRGPGFRGPGDEPGGGTDTSGGTMGPSAQVYASTFVSDLLPDNTELTVEWQISGPNADGEWTWRALLSRTDPTLNLPPSTMNLGGAAGTKCKAKKQLYDAISEVDGLDTGRLDTHLSTVTGCGSD